MYRPTTTVGINANKEDELSSNRHKGGGCIHNILMTQLIQRSEGRWISPHDFQNQWCYLGNDCDNGGRGTASVFTAGVGGSGWSLSSCRRIHSLDSRCGGGGGCVESLDVHDSQSSRYLLTGSRDGILSVYDLSNAGAEERLPQPLRQYQNQQQYLRHDSRRPRGRTFKTWVHHPVARSNATPVFPDETTTTNSNIRRRRGLGSVISARWYPMDTGVFVSAHTSGSVVIWDTNAMTPVIRVFPFAGEDDASNRRYCHSRVVVSAAENDSNETLDNRNIMALSCMDLSPAMAHLVATGSCRSALIKLVDLRTGAASHTLTGHGGATVARTTATSTASSTITSLQWSPTVPHILASGCTRGIIRLWDIRKAGRYSWLKECLDPDQPRPSFFLSHAYYPDLSHLRLRQQEEQQPQNVSKSQSLSSTTSNRSRGKSSSSSTKQQQTPGPNDYSISSKVALVRSHDGMVDSLAFDPSGQYLVSHGKGDLSLKVWDLRDAGQLIPRRYRVSARQHSGGVATIKIRITQPNHHNDSTLIWVTQGAALSAFRLHEGGSPQYSLTGHLDTIRDFFVLPTDASLPGHLLTSGADGLILVWQPHLGAAIKRPIHKARSNLQQSTSSSSISGQRKHHKRSRDDDMGCPEDEDSW